MGERRSETERKVERERERRRRWLSGSRFHGYRRLSHLGTKEHRIAEAIATIVSARERDATRRTRKRDRKRERERERGEKRNSRANRIWQSPWRGVAIYIVTGYVCTNVRARDAPQRAGTTSGRRVDSFFLFFLPRGLRSYARVSHFSRTR